MIALTYLLCIVVPASAQPTEHLAFYQCSDEALVAGFRLMKVGFGSTGTKLYDLKYICKHHNYVQTFVKENELKDAKKCSKQLDAEEGEKKK